jgi:small subunit ribosomal protein S1
MVKNRELVYEKAEEMAAKFREKMLAQKQAKAGIDLPVDSIDPNDDISDEILEDVPSAMEEDLPEEVAPEAAPEAVLDVEEEIPPATVE